MNRLLFFKMWDVVPIRELRAGDIVCLPVANPTRAVVLAERVHHPENGPFRIEWGDNEFSEYSSWVTPAWWKTESGELVELDQKLWAVDELEYAIYAETAGAQK